MSTPQEELIESASIPLYYRLGASLYVPATRADLGDIVSGRRLSEVRSIVICTEDAVHASELPICFHRIQIALRQAIREGLLVFIRPRSPDVLARLLSIPEVAMVQGFVLPKLDFTNLESYRRVLERNPSFGIMPTIETDIAFFRNRIIGSGKRCPDS